MRILLSHKLLIFAILLFAQRASWAIDLPPERVTSIPLHFESRNLSELQKNFILQAMRLAMPDLRFRMESSAVESLDAMNVRCISCLNSSGEEEILVEESIVLSDDKVRFFVGKSLRNKWVLQFERRRNLQVANKNTFGFAAVKRMLKRGQIVTLKYVTASGLQIETRARCLRDADKDEALQVEIEHAGVRKTVDVIAKSSEAVEYAVQ